jgi:mRNA interferase RelE/StbE
MEVIYSKRVVKKSKKGKLPYEVWRDFKDAFESLARTCNFRLFDIKKLARKRSYVYYRMRLGSYRALFYFDDHRIYVEDIGTRGEIYKP